MSIKSSLIAASVGVFCVACAADTTTTGTTGSNVAVNVAPLQLDAITDACWDIEVKNQSGDRVFAKRVTSRQYGNGQGDVSYVGPCDATSGEAFSTVYLDLVGIYDGAATCAPAFADGDDLDTGSEPFNDGFGILQRPITCSENADVAVDFNVTVLRPADQGFFDVAVNFDNIFCSAKLDCCSDDDDDWICDESEQIKLLHHNGVRDTTVVLGLACTAGVGDAETTLLMDDIVIDCGESGVAVINPDGGAGNLYGTAAVTDADGLLFQAAVYRGEENVGFSKRYWNVALGIDAATFAAAECWLSTKAGADDANADGTGAGVRGAQNQYIAKGDVYPYVAYTVPLTFQGELTCFEEALDAGPFSFVSTTYTTTDAGNETCFDHSYPAVTASGTQCDLVAKPLAMECVQTTGDGNWLGKIGEKYEYGLHYYALVNASSGVIAGAADPWEHIVQPASTLIDAPLCPGQAEDVLFTTSDDWYIAKVQATGPRSALCDPTRTIGDFTVLEQTNAVDPNAEDSDRQPPYLYRCVE